MNIGFEASSREASRTDDTVLSANLQDEYDITDLLCPVDSLQLPILMRINVTHELMFLGLAGGVMSS